ncbi:hypothetical protein ID866_10144 [Astraeus odoratus]|nr:hypothetical protein ID866_10144 [Astraeus odoratus]
MVKLQEKFWQKWVWEAEEANKCKEAKEAEKRAHKAEEAEKRECKVAGGEAKKWQCAESEARPSGTQGTKCIQCAKVGTRNGGKKKKRMRRAWPIFDDNNDDNDIVVTSTHKARKSESGVWEMMAQVVDRRMGEVIEELRGLRKGVAAMAKFNWDLAWVLYCGFQSMDTLVNEVQIFGAEGFLPKPALESELIKDELQETLREVKELQEEHLEWVMECLQMRKEWMWQEEATLTKHLKGKGKELAKEKEQEEGQGTRDEEDQGTKDEEGKGVAE